MTNKLKIFLAYHKNSPCYKSEVFQPVYAGTANGKENINFAIPDNTGDNISVLNPYYCELTMHYWVLKNYISTCNEEYIGFGHYRRLPDIPNISDKDYPSVYGCKYSDSLKLFSNWENEILYNYCTPYDIILPCSVYLYANTVNPDLRENEPHYNMYNQFKIEHDKTLPDVLTAVIEHYFPDYLEALKSAFKKEKIHCFNMYIMKKDVLKSFLEWEFAVLNKTGDMLGGWEQQKYSRMAGFLGERLINVWLEKNNSYQTGYFPTLMIDLEADYIVEANRLHKIGDYWGEISVLKKYLPVSSNKFDICMTIAELYGLLKQTDDLTKSLTELEMYAKTAENYYSLSQIFMKYTKDISSIIKYYKKSMELNSEEKFYAQSFLSYAKTLKNIDIIDTAWNYMLRFDLTSAEKSDYEHFKKIKSMING